MPIYLLYLVIFFGLPVVVLGWLLRDTFPKYRATILWSLGFVFTLGLFWDWLSFRTGVWRYDSAATVGIWLDGLPVEEFLGFYLLGTLFIVGVILVVLKKSHYV